MAGCNYGNADTAEYSRNQINFQHAYLRPNKKVLLMMRK